MYDYINDHFARECTAKGTHDGKKKRDSLYQQQETGKQEKNQIGLLTMDDEIVNWGEHTEAEETNHALMAISSSNEDQLEDFKEFNRGSVTFGGSKGYISGKGRIRHKVLFTEIECLVVSSDFTMPDENQILLKVPRHHNMYSFDMKTPTPAKGFACLINCGTEDNGTEFKNRDMLEFYGNKGIKQ
ncbi:hypothetical protein Tco_1205327, partial [Tanacetum coccineum]